MMRSLWTAASGMQAQQLSIDNISNNISNVNTNGYKASRMEFKDLLYSNLKPVVQDTSKGGSPVTLQVGYGVKTGATTRDFKTGNIQETGKELDFAIEGEGFFTISYPDGTQKYTKDGTFKASPTEDATYLVTSEGYRVLNTDDEPITIDTEILISSLKVDRNGSLSVVNEDGVTEELDQTMKIVQFTNVLGLESIGENLYQATPAVGNIVVEDEMDNQTNRSTIKQGAIEASNVQIAQEMVNMIVTQRAYELNSKAIQTSDDMLSIANQLKR